MEFLRKLGLTALILLAIAAVGIDIGYGFFCIFDHQTTTDYFYIDDQTPTDLPQKAEELTPQQVDEMENRKLFEVNLYSNIEEKKNNEKTGVILEELKLNHFTDPSLSVNSIVSSGMQYVSDYDNRKGLYTSSNVYTVQQKPTSGENWMGFATGFELDALGKELNIIHEPSAEKEFVTKAEANNYVSPNFKYYESVNQGVTWNARGLQTQFNRKTEFIVKIGDEAYKLRLDKYLDSTWDNRPKNWWDWIAPWNWHRANDYGGKIEYYNWDMVFEDIMHAVLTNDMQTGIHYGAVNLSKYFTVTEHFNTETRKWDPASDADQQVTYAVVKFNYHTKGAIANKQSIFGIINDDSRFTLDDVTYDTDYGQHNIILELTTASLMSRYSDAYNGYFLSMSIDLQRRLKAMPPYKINITLDLNQKIDDKPIVGLDVNAFAGFELEKLTIRGNQDFYLLNNSLRGTNLQLINIADTVTIINVNSGVTL